jgi:hypothetical protein
MLMWGWRAEESEENVRSKIVEILGKRGYAASTSASGVPAFVRVLSDGQGGVIVAASGVSSGEMVAAELSRTFSVGGRYAEVDVQDRDVTATARDVSIEGALGFAEDLDDEASELCEDWFEGKKYPSDARDDLVAVLLGIDDGMPTGGTELHFAKRRGRVESLVDAVEKGATWDKMEVQGRGAIRITEPAGLRISVLEADELTRFEAAVRKRG